MSMESTLAITNILAATALSLTACGGDAEEEAASTAAATTPVVEETEPVEETAEPAPEPEEDPVLAALWRSWVSDENENETSEQPTFTSQSGVTARIDGIVIWPRSTEECTEEAALLAERDPLAADVLANAEACTTLQVSFDVPADWVSPYTDEAVVTVETITSPEGRQVDVYWAEFARAGTTDNRLLAGTLGGGLGSTAYIDVDGEVWEYPVPTELLPFDRSNA